MTTMINLGKYRPQIRFKGFFKDEKRGELPDYTEEYLKVLQRPMKPGLIEFVSTVIIGTMGYGKTELAKWIAVKVSKFYGAENVNAIMNRSADLKALLEAMDGRPVQLLFLDDSFGEMPEDIAKQFTLIRHRFKAVLEEAGKPESGVIIALFGIQDAFTLDKLARRVSTATIAKSSSGDQWYKNSLRQAFGDEGVRELDRITRKVTRNYDQDIKGRSVITITGYEKTGYIENEMVEGNPYTEVLSAEKGEGEDGGDYQGAVEEETNVDTSEVELIEAKQSLDFGVFVLSELIEMGVDGRNVKIFVRHLDGESSRVIASDRGLGISPRRVGQINEELKRSKLGYAAERALMKHMGSHQGWVHGGETTDEPDFIDHGGRRVISLKCYCQPDLTPNSGGWLAARISTKEYLAAQRLGYELQLWVYEMVNKTWYKWRVRPPNPTPIAGQAEAAPLGGDETETENAPHEPAQEGHTEEAATEGTPGPEQAEQEGAVGSGIGQFGGPDVTTLDPVAYFKAMTGPSGH